MKKHLILLSIAILTCLLLFSACSPGGSYSGLLSAFSAPSESSAVSSESSSVSSTNAESNTESSPVPPDKETLYAQVAQTNTIDGVFSHYENVSQDITYYDDISDEYNIIVYADQNMMAQEDSKDNVLIMQKDGSCGFDADLNIAYRHLFIGENTYQDYWDGTRQFILFASDWNTGESVTDLKIEGETYVLTTETPSEDIEGDTIINVYTVDAQTLFIQSVICSQRHSDGTSQSVCECILQYDVEPYEPSAVLLQQAFGKGRVVTVIADPDTENEQAYSVEVLPGISVQIYMDPRYTTLFEDRACTVAHQSEDNNLTANCTYYVCTGK